MKAIDIIKQEEINEDECDVCKLHEEAYTKIPDGIICPKCGKNHTFYEIFASNDGNQFTVVGGHNAYDPEEDINKYLVGECLECGTRIALIPTEIIYNGNHDIFYTGADKYITAPLPDIPQAIISSIQQYTTRIKEGEDLQPLNLSWWIKSDLEHMIAKYLFDNGFKK